MACRWMHCMHCVHSAIVIGFPSSMVIGQVLQYDWMGCILAVSSCLQHILDKSVL